MPELSFKVEGAEAVQHAAAPLLALKLRVTNRPSDQVIHTVVLRCQIQIEPVQRRYDPREQEKMRDLFGEPSRWSTTVKPMLWTNTSIVLPSFSDSILVDLQLPCTFDFNVAATKYFHALEEGEVPLLLLFSGTIFHAAPGLGLQVAQIPWDREAKFRLPVHVWKQMMDMYYPNTSWLQLRRDVFDRLYEYKVHHGIPTWEQTVEELLPKLEKRATS